MLWGHMMLSPENLAIVKSTVSILKEHGESLTRHFYQRMFSQNPEVIPLFNAAHQRDGAQQKALAQAICAYAAHIDNLGALGDGVDLIVNKHASLQIKPEHYPIVGSNLLASIREVLGEGATDQVINAWAQAYELLAGILISREAEIYKNQSRVSHGWQGFKDFKVIKKENEIENIMSLYLTPSDNKKVPDFKAGQYITVRIPASSGSTTMRNYSLSDSPGREYYRISVKRDGYVSQFLHNHIQAGETIEVAPPCGNFFLDLQTAERSPLIFLAGGIGVTPLLSMLYNALEHFPSRKIIFLHACLHEKVQAFKEKLDELEKKHPHLSVIHLYSESAQEGVIRSEKVMHGLLTKSILQSIDKENKGDYYFCGPKAFMRNIYHYLCEMGVSNERMHYEFFGPKEVF
jgi:nitric oxide dioxygenase